MAPQRQSPDSALRKELRCHVAPARLSLERAAAAARLHDRERCADQGHSMLACVASALSRRRRHFRSSVSTSPGHRQAPSRAVNSRSVCALYHFTIAATTQWTSSRLTLSAASRTMWGSRSSHHPPCRPAGARTIAWRVHWSRRQPSALTHSHSADCVPPLAARAVHERKRVRLFASVRGVTHARLPFFCKVQRMQGAQENAETPTSL